MTDNPLSNESCILWQKVVVHRFSAHKSRAEPSTPVDLSVTVLRSGGKDIIEIQTFDKRWTKRIEKGHFQVINSASIRFYAFLNPVVSHGQLRSLAILIEAKSILDIQGKAELLLAMWIEFSAASYAGSLGLIEQTLTQSEIHSIRNEILAR